MLLHPLHTHLEKPLRFNNPFDYEPHPLSRLAADEVLSYVEGQPELLADARCGKMFGVLVVEKSNPSLIPSGGTGSGAFSTEGVSLHTEGGFSSTEGTEGGLFYLAAYSGLLAGRNDWPFFVPPVFDAQQPDGHFKQTERHISDINAQLASSSSPSFASPSSPSPFASPLVCAAIQSQQELKQERRRLSEELQLWLFHQYRMLNARGEEKDLIEIWHDYHTSPKIRQRFPMPPGGSGDCCAPKLLQTAYLQGLRPVAIAEFWFGESPKGEIRHHGQFYPACRGKCLPILTYMLQGLEVEPASSEALHMDIDTWRQRLRILYEDPTLLVIEKPSGLLSVPGRIDAPSVESLLEDAYGQVFMPHRLDMDTSGVMVVARNETAYKNLQQQFYARVIEKRYIALVDTTAVESIPRSGTISLPLRPDPLDRPRQVVDRLHGKQAVSDYEVIECRNSRKALLSLTPHTGRTHQLRVHCAHPDGLGCPIVGDALYGQKADRLCLHAAALSFEHPLTGQRMCFEASQPEFI